MKNTNHIFLRLFSILTLIVMVSCQPASQQQTALQISTETASFLNDVLPNNNSSALTEYANDSVDIERLTTELVDIQWKSVPPKSSTDFQSATSAGAAITLNGDFARMIKLLGEQYDAGESSQHAYIDSMKILDSTLTGILNSHKQLADSSINQTGSILTYACLARSIISQELIKRDLEQHASLSLEQTKTLSDISRDQNYDKLDTLP